ncbi:enoyl-CoA hydratase/isomerase family protein [Thalassotalea fusca]
MSDVVLFDKLMCGNGKQIGVATLNSEKSLNALSGQMIELLYPQLLEWQQDSNVALVILQGAGEKAFCAGGDIVNLYKAMSAYPNEYSPEVEKYFTEEYRLDYLIHTYNKPLLVWGNGIVMGGGLGMMVGASHRVVTETSRIAMPEISIGLYPDVGGTWFLNRMPNNCGLFLGLTGASINAADAKYTKMADYFVENSMKQLLVDKLLDVNWGDTNALNHEKLSMAIKEQEVLSIAKMPHSNVKGHQAMIDNVVEADDLSATVDNILSVEVDDKWFNRAQASLKNGSAVSAQIVFKQLHSTKAMTLADCFRLELGLSVKCGQYGEFVEGIRALLIDKDNQPKWKYSNVNDVPEKEIDWFFESLWTADNHPLKNLN